MTNQPDPNPASAPDQHSGPTKAYAIHITRPGDGEHVVTVHYDGRITPGPAYDPDEAARIFWEAIQRHAPNRPKE